MDAGCLSWPRLLGSSFSAFSAWPLRRSPARARVDRRRSRLHVRDDVHQPDVGVAPAGSLIHKGRAIDAACPGATAGVHMEGRLAGTALDKEPHRASTRPCEVRPSARSRRLLEGRSRLDGDLGCGLCSPRRGQDHHRDHSRAPIEMTSSCAHQSSPNEARPYHFAPSVTSPGRPATPRCYAAQSLDDARSRQSQPDSE